MQVFEDRSSYTHGVDAVAKIVLSIECAPGQELAIIQWLGGVSKQAGVYCVDLSAPAVEVATPEVLAEPMVTEQPPEQPAGEQSGERLLQQANQEHQGTSFRKGSDATEGHASTFDGERADSTLAGTAGESWPG